MAKITIDGSVIKDENGNVIPSERITKGLGDGYAIQLKEGGRFLWFNKSGEDKTKLPWRLIGGYKTLDELKQKQFGKKAKEDSSAVEESSVEPKEKDEGTSRPLTEEEAAGAKPKEKTSSEKAPKITKSKLPEGYDIKSAKKEVINKKGEKELVTFYGIVKLPAKNGKGKETWVVPAVFTDTTFTKSVKISSDVASEYQVIIDGKGKDRQIGYKITYQYSDDRRENNRSVNVFNKAGERTKPVGIIGKALEQHHDIGIKCRESIYAAKQAALELKQDKGSKGKPAETNAEFYERVKKTWEDGYKAAKSEMEAAILKANNDMVLNLRKYEAEKKDAANLKALKESIGSEAERMLS